MHETRDVLELPLIERLHFMNHDLASRHACIVTSAGTHRGLSVRPRQRLGEAGDHCRQLLRVSAGDAVQLAGENAADGGQ